MLEGLALLSLTNSYLIGVQCSFLYNGKCILS